MSRRRALGLLVAAPTLGCAAADADPNRRWTVTGARVEKLDGLDAAVERFMRQFMVRAGSLAVAREGS